MSQFVYDMRAEPSMLAFAKESPNRTTLLEKLWLWPFLPRKTIREKKTETSFSGHTTLFSSYNAAD